jgi:hypothetical protein
MQFSGLLSGLRYVSLVKMLEHRSAWLTITVTLNPKLLIFLGEIIHKLRWDTSIQGVLQRRDPREPNAEKGPSAKVRKLEHSTNVCLLISTAPSPDLESRISFSRRSRRC